MEISELFTKDSNVKVTRGQSLKLEKPGCTGGSRKFFSHRVVGVGRWNSLHQEMVDAPSVSVFKGRLEQEAKLSLG